MSGLPGLRGFSGEVLQPSDPAFESRRRVENAAFDDRRPVLILRPSDVESVARAVAYARETGSDLAVRSGGHSIAGHSTADDALVIDLSALSSLRVDPVARVSDVGPGVSAAAYTNAAGEHGLATSFGDTGSVGLGGLVVGGGIGWLVRRHGLTIDSLLAAEVVTSEGSVLTASAVEHPDLFWSLRGGGGNFGIVTRYRLRLEPIGPVKHGLLLLQASWRSVNDVLELGFAAPDDLTIMPFLMVIPPMDEVPVEHHGKLGLWVETLWAGAAQQGQRVLHELRRVAPALLDTIEQKPYAAVYPKPSGERSAWTSDSVFVDHISEAAYAALAEQLESRPEDGERLVILRVLGGAAGRVPVDATAFGWRDKRLLAWIIADAGAATLIDDDHAWVRQSRDVLEKAGGEGAFVSFTGNVGGDVAERAYPPATLARLRQVKRAYDPANLFRSNHNIAPAD